MFFITASTAAQEATLLQARVLALIAIDVLTPDGKNNKLLNEIKQEFLETFGHQK